MKKRPCLTAAGARRAVVSFLCGGAYQRQYFYESLYGFRKPSLHFGNDRC